MSPTVEDTTPSEILHEHHFHEPHHHHHHQPSLDEKAELELPLRSPTPEEQPLWYLAYGSNLSPSVFQKRRGIKPLDQVNVLVEGLELTFDLPGLPYVEPRFANCRVVDTNPTTSMDSKGEGEWNPTAGKLIGMAYLVTPSDFATILKTEGGGSGYQAVCIRGGVQPLDQVHKRKDLDEVYTLLCSWRRDSVGWCSERYLKLIKGGAQENNLPDYYQKYLANVPAFSAKKLGVSQRIGKVLFITIWVPIFVPVFILGHVLNDSEGRNPQWISTLMTLVGSWMWKCHDNVFEPIFGSGERA